MLLFLQENILIAAITMTAIFVMIVLVLLFSAYTRRKQAL
jgi:ascorbate-specific PTS system EIIC-type component UlaA